MKTFWNTVDGIWQVDYLILIHLALRIELCVRPWSLGEEHRFE